MWHPFHLDWPVLEANGIAMQMMEKQALFHFPLHKAPYSNLNGFDLNSKEDWILNPFLRSVSLVSFSKGEWR